jgi:hypothetical protein
MESQDIQQTFESDQYLSTDLSFCGCVKICDSADSLTLHKI